MRIYVTHKNRRAQTHKATYTLNPGTGGVLRLHYGYITVTIHTNAPGGREPFLSSAEDRRSMLLKLGRGPPLEGGEEEEKSDAINDLKR